MGKKKLTTEELYGNHVKRKYGLDRTEQNTYPVDIFITQDQILKIDRLCKNRAELDLFIDFAIDSFIEEIARQERVHTILETPDRFEFDALQENVYERDS